LALAAAVLAYNLTKPTRDGPREPLPYETEATEPREHDGGVVSNIFAAPELTKFLIAGADENLLTDVIIVGCFNSAAKKIDLISIPRDTYVTFSDEDAKTLTDAGRGVPSGGSAKINSVYAYAGRDLGVQYLKKQVESIVGAKIDYYALIDLAGFRGMVDAIGGVYMEIRPQGFYYNDPEQGLVIAVPGGMQRLDGAAAEGVIRYRDDYARADIERIEMQHEFMKQFFMQALGGDALMKNAFGLASAMIGYMRTDFKLRDAVKYLWYIGDLKADNISFHTLPGENVYNGESFYMHDRELTDALAVEIFQPPAEDATEDGDGARPAEFDLKKLKIQILNGGDAGETAKDRADQLKAYGYNVINVGDYTGLKQIRTRFLVKAEGDYKALAVYFKNPSIEVDPDIPAVFDVVIITGLNE